MLGAEAGPRGRGAARVGSAIRDAFRRREPYNYLQRAYYQVRGPGVLLQLPGRGGEQTPGLGGVVWSGPRL